ncbi:MAG: type I-B CRISPR-associated endonuclease Cas1b [Cuniculiplasma sp.]
MYTIYISQNGKLERNNNTLFFYGIDFKRALPVQNISEIIISSKVSLSSWAIDYLTKLGIMVHFIDTNGRFHGSYIPFNRKEKGSLTVLQALAYSNTKKRIEIASEIVNGIRYNIKRNIRYYNHNGSLEEKIESFDSIFTEKVSIEGLLGVEGKPWSIYYSTFDQIYGLKKHFKREYFPPPDEVNSLISYGNSLLYSTCITAIAKVGLNPSISFLHEPSDRSFSLALDLADIFKPVIVERLVSTFINNKMLQERYFEERDGGVYLSSEGRKIFLEKYSDKMETSVKLKNGKYVKYDTMIEMECRKLLNSILDNEPYFSFRAWD